MNEYGARISRYLEILGSRRQRGSARMQFSDVLEELGDITYRQLSDDMRGAGLCVADDKTFATQDAEHVLRRMLEIQVQTEAQVAPTIAPALTKQPTSLKLQSLPEVMKQEKQYRHLTKAKNTFLLFPAKVTDPITPKQYQIQSVATILFEMHGTAILADEVGLGKTLTACFLMLELFLRDPSLNCLILVPPNLLNQWSGELARLRSVTGLQELKFSSQKKLSTEQNVQLLLMSTERAKSEHNSQILMDKKWGLVIVDEAHELRNPETARHKLVYSLTARHRLLVTGTPVNNSGYDIYNLVNLIRPGYFGTRENFQQTYVPREREIVESVELQQRLTGVVIRQTRDTSGVRFAKRRIETIQVESQMPAEERLYGDVLSLLRGIWKRHRSGAVMITRPSGQEQRVDSLVLTAMMVLRELGSHPRAALSTLRKALRDELAKSKDVEGLARVDAILTKYETVLWKRGTHAKTDFLMKRLGALVECHGKLIIFVEFLETQDALVERAEAILGRKSPGIPVFKYRGDFARAKKANIVAAFTRAPRAVLISTDAGGQGLNLQTAATVINFDFPWNPMKIEQRIGRVDRIGQVKNQIQILNFLTKGTIEQYVYLVLEEKLRVCEDVLGSLQSPVLRFMLSRRDEQLGIGQIILSSESESDMAAEFRKLSLQAYAVRSHGDRIAKKPHLRAFPQDQARANISPLIIPAPDSLLGFNARYDLFGNRKGRSQEIVVWRAQIGYSLSLGNPNLQFHALQYCGGCGEVFWESSDDNFPFSDMEDERPAGEWKLSREFEGLIEAGQRKALDYLQTDSVTAEIKRLTGELRKQFRQLKSLYLSAKGKFPSLRGFARRGLHSERAIEAERDARSREITERFQCQVIPRVVSIGKIRVRYPGSLRKHRCLGKLFLTYSGARRTPV